MLKTIFEVEARDYHDFDVMRSTLNKALSS